jgi:hypothetical protein
MIGVVAAVGIAAIPVALQAATADSNPDLTSVGGDYRAQSSSQLVEPKEMNIVRSGLPGEAHEQAAPASVRVSDLHTWQSVPDSPNLLSGSEPIHTMAPFGAPELTDSLANDPPLNLPMLALGIAIPSPDMLQGALVNSDHASDVGEVSSALVDALAGGTAPSVDHLLDALPDHGTGGMETLGSFAASTSVGPAWEIGLGSMEQHVAFSFEQVMFHQDAVPAV